MAASFLDLIFKEVSTFKAASLPAPPGLIVGAGSRFGVDLASHIKALAVGESNALCNCLGQCA